MCFGRGICGTPKNPMAGRVSSLAAGLTQLIAKYWKVALALDLSISAASFTGCYVAIKNNVDVATKLQRVGLLRNSEGLLTSKVEDEAVKEAATDIERHDEVFAVEISEMQAHDTDVKDKNRMSAVVHAAVSSSEALALAFLCNKALWPVRLPIAVALTPRVARLWAGRKRNKRKP